MAGSQRFTIFILVLLLLSPFSFVVGESPSEDEEKVNPTLWTEISPSGMIPVDLRESTGVLHLSTGAFDPLLQEDPTLTILPTGFSSQVVLIQLHTTDAMVLAELADIYSLSILDHMPDEAWIVRVPSQDRIPALENESSVRWISPLNIAWRMSEGLQQVWVEPPSLLDISLILAPDLSEVGIEQLETRLKDLQAREVWCGWTQCEIWGMEWNNGQITNLIADDSILHISLLEKSAPLNSYAAQTVELDEVLGTLNMNLDGSGEVIGVSDTGIDSSHPDLNQKILSIKTQYGLDSSSLDKNTGHGTHVVGTIIGDGISDSEAKGLASGSSMHFQALEHDNTGFFGRQGSLYDMLRDFYTAGARTGSNSWGAPGAQGEYTSDSRSVDHFANDYDDFTVLFAAGESNVGVAAPSTAKNVLSIGAATSERPNSLSAGEVWNQSANGFSADGRIKPDLVAPGIEICSTMSEQALSPLGVDCGSGIHSNGDSLYRSSNGSSHATAVAAASVLLTREFLREEANVNAPSADLVRATLINGARDLGVQNIPNAQEGWGQIDLSNSFSPKDGSTALASFYDTNISLSPGFGFIYGFDFNAAHGISITLVWTDVAGSASALQSESRLVNDLDLILTAPDGTIWFGNDFSNGLSATTGIVDSTNVVERIELAPGAAPQSGTWSIQVANRAGSEQSFALVVVADGDHDPASDLTVFDESIRPSSTEPLVNELISISVAWTNQAPLVTGSYKVTLVDTTTGTTLSEMVRSGTAGGQIESASITHAFSTTGAHILRLTIDVDDQIAELNDGNSGYDNNVKQITINVSALGVRLIPLLDDGSEPTTPEQNSAAVMKSFEANTDSQIEINMILRHEGTGSESVTLTSGSVRMLNPQREGVFQTPPDSWTKSINVSSPLSMAPAGDIGDEQYFTLTLLDEDADPNGDIPRYAYAGTYVIDLEARYQLQPLVKHKLRITFVVNEVDDVDVVIAGTSGLSAKPGEVADFSVSVRNMGNNPATYKVECQSENRWQIELGSGTSSSQIFEPLGLLEGLPMRVKVRVPNAVAGSPVAGSSDVVNCWITSLDDESLNYSLQVDISVDALDTFSVQLINPSGENVGPAAMAPTISVSASEQYNHTLMIENTGNMDLELSISLDAEDNTWPLQLIHEEEEASTQLDINVAAGTETSVEIQAVVPKTANEGKSNSIDITTWLKGGNSNLGAKNSTTLLVRKDVGIDFSCNSNYNSTTGGLGMQVTVGDSSTLNCFINNTGNAQLDLIWSVAEGPDENWVMGFAAPPASLSPYQQATVMFLAKRSEGSQVGENFLLQLRVIANHSNQSVSEVVVVSMSETNSAYLDLEFLGEEEFNLLESKVGTVNELEFKITNIGNTPGTWTPLVSLRNSEGEDEEGWELSCDLESGINLEAKGSTEFICTITPQKDAGKGICTLFVFVQSSQNQYHIGSVDPIEFDVSAARIVESSGLFAGLTTQTTGIIVGVILLLVSIVGVRLRKVNREMDEGEMLVAPGSHSSQTDFAQRREDATDIGHKTNEIASGSVSSEEVAAALAQSVSILPPPGPAPSASKRLPPLLGSASILPQGLPPLLKSPPPQPAQVPIAKPATAPAAESFTGPPVPAGGLPAGWTMQQWQHYGEEWLKKQP
ncbi:S8 family serine peptidase [Deltaproteobacteria bacterium]|nr:S8 family serine peptidase [Deltaproteobacteria bacterium]